jgi:redox-sensitive bicupin YhaK (pirin superfamily)
VQCKQGALIAGVFSHGELCVAGSLHVSKPTHWLESRFHFSFANYFNPKNMSFGALRVMNDDLVTAGDGFGCASCPCARQPAMVQLNTRLCARGLAWSQSSPELFTLSCMYLSSSKSTSSNTITALPCRTHGHRDAEIFSYILDGELSHRDSMGNQESLGRGTPFWQACM